jgi:hypothetical protein
MAIAWLVVALASSASARADAAEILKLTPDQQSLILRVAQQELTRHRNGWKPSTPLCLRVGVIQDDALREPRIPPRLLRSLKGGGRKVVSFDRCVVTVGDTDRRYRDPEGKPAYLLFVNVSIEDTDSATVSVTLADSECEPLACTATDLYGADKTKRGWTVEYRDRALH